MPGPSKPKSGEIEAAFAAANDTASLASFASGVASGGALTKYEIRVVTADEKSAGTDANVFFQMYGAMGDSGAHKLATSSTFRDKFERGHTDVFSFELPDLGQLSKLRIWYSAAKLDSFLYAASSCRFVVGILIVVPPTDA